MDNNSKQSKAGRYALRCIGTIAIGCVSAIVLYYLSNYVILEAYRYLTANGSQIMEGISKNAIIPGWGTWSISRPDLSSTISLIITGVIALVMIGIFYGLLFLDKKLVNGSKAMTIITGVILAAEFIVSSYFIFFTNLPGILGLQNAGLFYFISIVAQIFHAGLISFELYILWTNEDMG